MEQSASIDEILARTYKYGSVEQQVVDIAARRQMVKELSLDGEITVTMEGMEFPEKGLVVPKDLWSINIAKRMMIELLRNTSLLWSSLLLFMIIPWKRKVKAMNRVIKSLNVVLMKVMAASILKDEYMTPLAQELKVFIFNFLDGIGIEGKEAYMFAEVFSNVINFDSAYRYRLHDLFNETSVDKLANPRKEIKRLILLNRERETELGPLVSDKFKIFANLVSFTLIHPKIKKAFLAAVQVANFDKLRPDDADRFWMCVRGGYDFFGKPHQERLDSISHLKVAVYTPKVV